MKKRTLIKILSFLLALLVAVAVFGFKYFKRAKNFETEISYTYSRSLEEVNSSLNKISVALEKLPFISSAGQITQLATDIYTEAKIAKQAFSQLPTGQSGYENINKFLSQVGNYTVFLAEKVIGGGELNDSEKNNINLLSSLAENITESFGEMQININSSGYWAQSLEESIEIIAGNDVFLDSLNMLEESIIDYPTLLYDGPYSDHISSGTSYLVENSEAITEETALNIAANALRVDKEEIAVDNYDNGKIPAINFVYGEGTASVSINGGYLINFRKYNVGQETNLTYRQAQIKAEKFVAEILSRTFAVNYYFADNGTCVFNFARTDGGVIFYPDLIKVGVDMSNGDIVFFDARAYIMNYKERELELPPESRMGEARALIDKSLTVLSTALALIPTDGEFEKLCYEFLCRTGDEREFLIYINTETLKEEQIFTVFKTNGGTLVK